MKILIDTSVWIEFFRRRGNPTLKTAVADLIRSKQAAFTCPIQYELFFGARKQELPNIREGLTFAFRVPMTERHWDQAAAHAHNLRAKGVTIPTSDLLIATVAENERLPLLANDIHFKTVKDSLLPNLTSWTLE